MNTAYTKTEIIQAAQYMGSGHESFAEFVAWTKKHRVRMEPSHRGDAQKVWIHVCPDRTKHIGPGEWLVLDPDQNYDSQILVDSDFQARYTPVDNP